MNFVAQVEEHLRDLGTEARKNHPGRSVLYIIGREQSLHVLFTV